jgi:ATP-dependent Clp protease ATP-binding subunit ClpX
LKLIEGTIAQVPPHGGRKHPNQELIQVDTSKILFIVGGAFEGLDKIVEQRTETDTGIGFSAAVRSSNEKKTLSERYQAIEPEDLVKFGLIPEFVGRLPMIASLEELDVKALVKILTEPKNALVKQFQKMFELENVELQFRKDAIEEVANLAIKRKTGARGLRSIMEQILLETMYDLPSLKNVEKVVINKAVVLGKKTPMLVYNENEPKAVSE